MIRRIFPTILALVLALIFAFPVSAHPGDTDAAGGHIDHSTGTYHYHHGYEAHSHKGGVCPYDFDDKTGWNSGSSSSSSYNSSFNLHSAYSSALSEAKESNLGEQYEEALRESATDPEPSLIDRIWQFIDKHIVLSTIILIAALWLLAPIFVILWGCCADLFEYLNNKWKDFVRSHPSAYTRELLFKIDTLNRKLARAEQDAETWREACFRDRDKLSETLHKIEGMEAQAFHDKTAADRSSHNLSVNLQEAGKTITRLRAEAARIRTDYERVAELLRAQNHRLEVAEAKVSTYTHFIERFGANAEAFFSRPDTEPKLRRMMADYLTLVYDASADYLDQKERPAHVEAKRIRELKAETKEWIDRALRAEYELERFRPDK